MPHATFTQDNQYDHDEELLQRVLTFDPRTDLDVFNRELDTGEKADDAIDYEDLGDDDLAEDDDAIQEERDSGDRDMLEATEDALEQHHHLVTEKLGVPEIEDFDDLFGDAPSAPNVPDATRQSARTGSLTEFSEFTLDRQELNAKPSGRSEVRTTKSLGIKEPSLPNLPASGSKDVSLSREQQLQQDLFAMSRSGFGAPENILPVPPENHAELLASLWPKYERNKTPRFMDLLPPKKARYVGKPISRRPKLFNPTKVHLELAQDQEKTFRLSSGAPLRNNRESGRQSCIDVHQEPAEEKSSDDGEMHSDFANDTVGAVSWQDLQMVCEDWDSCNSETSTSFDNIVPRNADLGDSPKRKHAEISDKSIAKVSRRSVSCECSPR